MLAQRTLIGQVPHRRAASDAALAMKRRASVGGSVRLQKVGRSESPSAQLRLMTFDRARSCRSATQTRGAAGAVVNKQRQPPSPARQQPSAQLARPACVYRQRGSCHSSGRSIAAMASAVACSRGRSWKCWLVNELHFSWAAAVALAWPAPAWFVLWSPPDRSDATATLDSRRPTSTAGCPAATSTTALRSWACRSRL